MTMMLPSDKECPPVVIDPSRGPLEPIFAPRSVALIGASATEGNVGRTLMWNLISNPFGGAVYPVNPKRRSVLGVRCYPDIGSVPERVDLAVIATAAATVPDLVRQCAEAHIPAAVIISAGFGEMGAEGAKLEQQVLEHARRGRMRIIGPNCLGVMAPRTGLNATFAAGMAKPGSVAFLSQSGALCTAILDWSLREGVGFSGFVSTGAMLDVGWGDLIAHFGDDPATRSILIYMESIGDARAFLSAAREVALSKPIIVIKAGRTEAAAKAAASHTGALTGSDAVLDAAFRRAGVLRVERVSDLFYMAEVLGKQPRPKGRRLTILTNAGGPGVLATDALIAGGGELAPLPPETADQLNAILPPHWSRGNPIDVLGDAKPDRYAKALHIADANPESDALLVVLTPQDMTEPTETAEQLAAVSKQTNKPLLTCWMGGESVAAAHELLNRAGVATFEYPDSAARAFNYMWQYSASLAALYETPALAADRVGAADRATAEQIITGARKAGRTLLTESETKRLLSAYGIPVVRTEVARTTAAAVALAEAIGYPVVVKLNSNTITHKSDVGGVVLDVRDAQGVIAAFERIEATVRAKHGKDGFDGVTVQAMIRMSDAYELIIGSNIDAQFGPVLMFGAGGQLVEVNRDRALGLPPLTDTLARRMMEQTRIYGALKGVRGRAPADIAGLERLLVRFGELVLEQRWIKEIEINPLLVSGEKIVALDARAVLHDADSEEQLPRPAIRPYPTQYVQPSRMKDGSTYTLRPIRPEDERLMVKFHQTLSEQSVRFRYFNVMHLDRRVAHERLVRVCFSDYDRQIVLVAERTDAATGEPQILAVGRIVRAQDPTEAEFAIIVGDPWQGRGLGRALLESLKNVARAEGIKRLYADILAANNQMQRLCSQVGFKITVTEDPCVSHAEMEL